MKTILTAGFCLLVVIACAQKKDLSDELKGVIAKNYPNATIKSHKQAKNLTKAKIEHEGVMKSVKFDAKNQWQGTIYYLTVEQMPNSIMNAAKSKSKGGTFKRCEVVESPNKETIYNLTFEKKNGVLIYLKINSSGKVLETKEVEPKSKDSMPKVKPPTGSGGDDSGGSSDD
ncbi:MAG: hypothetical protein JXR10_07210 [Cyclobacteriaceae bacterium]